MAFHASQSLREERKASHGSLLVVAFFTKIALVLTPWIKLQGFLHFRGPCTPSKSEGEVDREDSVKLLAGKLKMLVQVCLILSRAGLKHLPCRMRLSKGAYSRSVQSFQKPIADASYLEMRCKAS